MNQAALQGAKILVTGENFGCGSSSETAETDTKVTVDLQAGIITTPLGNTLTFEINALRREAGLEGLNAIGVILKRDSEIAAFRARDQKIRAWVYQVEPSD